MGVVAVGHRPSSIFFLLATTALLTACGSHAQKVGLISTEMDHWYRADVPLRLSETGKFEEVSYLNESVTLEELQEYHALLVWSGIIMDDEIEENTDFIADIRPFSDPELLGNVLQAYLDQGGGVVLALAGFSGENGLKGAFAADSSVILPGKAGTNVALTNTGEAETKVLGDIYLPDHPVIRNISSLESTRTTLQSEVLNTHVSKMAADSYIVATWNDRKVLAVARDGVGPSKSSRVDINMHPVSKRQGDFYSPGRNAGGYTRTTQGADLLAAALLYSMSGCASFSPQPLTIVRCSEAYTGVGEGDQLEVYNFTSSSSLRLAGTCHEPLNITQNPLPGTLVPTNRTHNVTLRVEDALGTVVECTTIFYATKDTTPSSTSASENDSSSSESQATDTGERDSSSNSDSNLGMILGLSLGLPFLLLLPAAIALALLFRRKTKRKARRIQKDLEDGTGESMYQISPIKSGSQPSHYESTFGPARGIGFNWNIQFSELTFGEEIGRGGFGVVRKGKWRGTAVAIKQILAKHNDELEQMRSEMEIMKNLRPHGNVLLLLGVCEDDYHNHYVVTEFMARGDLRHFLMSEQGQSMVDHQMMLAMAKEIAVGLSHLHSEGIIHRDLASRNLLLTEEYSIKISDFGLSRLKRDTESEEQTTKSEVGPLKWMAPESISQQTYSHKSDVWSYGVVLWELTNFGEEPYPELSLVQAALAVVDEKMTPTIPSDIPSVLQEIMRACWQYDPKDRPTMEEIVSMLSNAS
ncbi:Tyrosine-protein kinase abl1 [Balamuthia mandrillaris]